MFYSSIAVNPLTVRILLIPDSWYFYYVALFQHFQLANVFICPPNSNLIR